jgi:protein-L-isoaspartate(D-aspartate) O-methyltransferase
MTNVILEIEMRVVHPHRAADPPRYQRELLPKTRHHVQPRPDHAEDVVRIGRWSFEQTHAADVHMRVGSFEVEEQLIEDGKALEPRHTEVIVAAEMAGVMPRSQEGLARLIEREGLRNSEVVDAFRAVDRADFVPEGHRFSAYRDRPVGLPEEQTTSQPSLIARMLDATRPGPHDIALEVGTGYGFQTALLARLVQRVVSIERHPSLASKARVNLERAGITNVDIVVGDGWAGYPDAAPYDVIVVSAAAAAVPDALVEQLRDGGRMVIPIREARGDNVYLFVKRDGRLHLKRLVTPARFVPLVRSRDTER